MAKKGRKKRPITRTPTKRRYKVNGKRRLYVVWKDRSGKVHRHLAKKEYTPPVHRYDYDRRRERRKRMGKNTYHVDMGSQKGPNVGIKHKLDDKNEVEFEVNLIDGASVTATHKTKEGDEISVGVTPTGPKGKVTKKLDDDTTISLEGGPNGFSVEGEHKNKKARFI